MRRSIALAASLTVVASLATAVTATAVPGPYDPYFAQPTTIADFGATSRPFGLAAGDFDEDGAPDLVVGRTTGNVAFVAGTGDGTFDAPTVFAWKQAFFNAWAFATGDLNGDAHLDVVWGASAAGGGAADGDVRVWYGNGDGTFVETLTTINAVTYNAGALLADIGTDTGSLAVGDLDGDGDDDVVAGATEGVRILRNDGGGVFTSALLDTTGVYFPATSTQNSPWGLAVGDGDGDGDLDLWVGDRALYVYLYANNGSGSFTIVPGNIPEIAATRPNVYLRHDPTYRAAVGYTASLASADVNGDGIDDLFLGLHSGTQTPATAVVHDGEILLDVSGDGRHATAGSLADLGTMTRGLQVTDADGDGAVDLAAAVYEGTVQLLRQLPPIDTDGDGISDYVDNAPTIANAPRLDMNADGAVNRLDQLDNDFDTVLGDPEDPSTWQRLGDPIDDDDDGDGVADAVDDCVFTADPSQADADGDGRGDACDPLDDRDPDADGVPTGPVPGDPLHDEALAAKIRWSEGDTHFVLRIDALGRFFQNEFTQLMADAAILTEDEWAAKCWEDYGAGDPTDPCGTGEGTASQTLTLPGGRDQRLSLVTIPKQLWTDPPVVDWINDRNDSDNLDLAAHATYHVDNTTNGDWADQPDRDFYSCEVCGLTLAESVELLTVGRDTLLGDYDNRWIADSGATAASPRIDWATSANPLISYAPPFNADDATGREAVALLGFKAHSSSRYEEGEAGSLGAIFTPEGSHHEAFDQFGLFHVSDDVQFDPLAVPDGVYDAPDRTAFAAHLAAETEAGGLNTWLIEEVEWSGRPCNEDDRTGTCAGGYEPRGQHGLRAPVGAVDPAPRPRPRLPRRRLDDDGRGGTRRRVRQRRDRREPRPGRQRPRRCR